MNGPACLLALAFAGAAMLPAQSGGDFVYRSEVSLVRVDAQVMDRYNRTITGLRVDDFTLREEGKPQQIRHFGYEETPVDFLLLLDVSGSMRPHMETIADASQEAVQVLGPDDRVAVMVFDRSTRLRLPFGEGGRDVSRRLRSIVSDESFDGGTDITRALLDACRYIGREARRGARRAIVIVTDDQTERDRDEEAVDRALMQADAVLSVLLAPDAMRYRGWSTSGSGGTLGGVILGRRRRIPGPSMGGRTRPAGTPSIAQASGGDSIPVDDASALQTTLARIRQRYALHFHLPEGVKPGEERNIEVELSDAARRRHPDATVRFRRVYLAPGGSADAEMLARTPSNRPRPGVSERSSGETGPMVESGQPASKQDGSWRRVEDPDRPGRWRKVTPDN